MSNDGQEPQHQRAFAIILCLFLAYMWKEMVWDAYFVPPAPPVVQQAGQTPATPAATSAPAHQAQTTPAEFSDPTDKPLATPLPTELSSSQPTANTVDKAYANPSDSQMRNDGVLTIETTTVRAQISKLGGRILEFVLKDYEANQVGTAERLNLVEHVEGAPFPLGVYSGNVNDSLVNYSLVSAPPVNPQTGNYQLAEHDEATFDLQGTLPDGRKISKVIRLYGNSYFIDASVTVDKAPADGTRLALEWTKLIPKDSPSLLDPYQVSGFVWFDGKQALRVSFHDMKTDTLDFPEITWLSVADKYFMAAMVSNDGQSMGRAIRSGQLYRARLFGSDTKKDIRLFLGPKSYRLLTASKNELHRVINFGWTGIIAAPLLSLLHLFYSFLGNYGLAIVALTIMVKMALYPLTSSSFKQMKALQDLAPDMKRIRETITDKQQQQLELMNLYKDKGVNPLGGCLPILLQMPVFIGLYSALLLAIELRHAPFAFWIRDLSAPEKLMITSTFGIPILVVLFVISMLGQQLTTPTNADPMQKRMMLIMPLVFGFMFANMPAGLTLYWLTNNLISIGQQVGLRRENGKHGIIITVGVAATVFFIAFALVKFSH